MNAIKRLIQYKEVLLKDVLKLGDIGTIEFIGRKFNRGPFEIKSTSHSEASNDFGIRLKNITEFFSGNEKVQRKGHELYIKNQKVLLKIKRLKFEE